MRDLPDIGSFVGVRWNDGVIATGEVEDHAEDGSGFDLGFTFVDVREASWEVIA